MPGFDGSGPRGAGPMTGQGQGYCIVPLTPGAPRPVAAKPGPGGRWGRNACRKVTGGLRRKNCFRNQNP
ncbi:MAG: DUF5320 domain-containing protein [Thermoanaerobacteraceae bacterium]|nr:DUF5320 domain-containing protein [Thermoanaerobacteraceae bacterium]